MAVPASTAPTVKAWLTAAITAACTADPSFRLLVTYGDPQSGADDYVTVGKVSRTVEPHAIVGTMGANSLRETYTVDIEIQVFRKSSPVATETRLFALLAQVETVVREQLADVIRVGDPVASLGGHVWRITPPDEHEIATEQSSNEGFWWSHTTYPLLVNAII